MDKRVPKHIAIIMDRNGEWAKRRALARIMGHREGVKTVKRVIKAAMQENIGVISLFAFSTENWLRPQEEVSFLMSLLEEFIKIEAKELISEGIKLIISGRLDRIPVNIRAAIKDVMENSKNNKKMVLNIALDYGGKDEIVRAAANIAQKVLEGKLAVDDISEEVFQDNLYHPELPEVDLMIRTGGEQRVSNFMLWEIAYAELYFTDVLWPDFGREDLIKAIEVFSKRKRRFGKTDEQLNQ